MTLETLKTSWTQFQIDHPRLAQLVVVIESAAIGAAVDVLTNGLDFSQVGLKHAGTIIGTAVVVAVRNYLRDNTANLKLRLDDQKNEPTSAFE